MNKAWDLNVYFRETEWDDDIQDYKLSDTIYINPVLWTMENGVSNVIYSNWVVDTTFAETRYIRSQYAEDEYGYDWTDSLDGFLKIAPPRLKQILLALPPAETIDESKVQSLVG